MCVSMYCRSNRNHRNIYSNLYIEFTHNGTETNFLHKYILHYHSATYKSKLVPAASMRARQAHAIPKWPPNWLRNPELLNWLDKTFVFPPIRRSRISLLHNNNNVRITYICRYSPHQYYSITLVNYELFFYGTR